MKHKVGWDLARILHRSAPGSDKRERKLSYLESEIEDAPKFNITGATTPVPADNSEPQE